MAQERQRRACVPGRARFPDGGLSSPGRQALSSHAPTPGLSLGMPPCSWTPEFLVPGEAMGILDAGGAARTGLTLTGEGLQGQHSPVLGALAVLEAPGLQWAAGGPGPA